MDGANGCVSNLTDIERAINIAYCATSFTSFLMVALATVLNIYSYCRQNGCTEYIEFLLSFFLMFFSLLESFQWLAIFAGKSEAFKTGCIVTAFFYQYCLIAVLTNMTCIAIHLLLQVYPPKCMAVIDLEKKKKYKCLMWLYLFLDTTVPLLYAPWPFIAKAYGQNEIICWIPKCKDQKNIWKITLWYIWPLGVIAFVFAVIVVVFITLSLRTSVKCNTTVVALLIFMSGFSVAAIVSGVNFLIHPTEIILSDVLANLPVPTVLLLTSLVLVFRAIYIIQFKPKKYLKTQIKERKSEKQPLLATSSIQY